MCGQFTIAIDKRTLEERFSFEAPNLQFVPSFNVAPTQGVLTVTRNGENQAQYMRWGLIYGWNAPMRGQKGTAVSLSASSGRPLA